MDINKIASSTIKYIQNISEDIKKSILKRHFFFAFATFLSILIMGYYYGTFDQAIHLPFLSKYADPQLFPNDKFIETRYTHFSYFWFFFVPFYKLRILEISMFLTYVGCIYLTFWSLWSLSETLFKKSLTSVLTILAFIVPHASFAGFTVIEFSLVNRVFVLPFLLFAINYYLKKQYLWAFMILGIMYNFHIISVNFVLAMFCFDILVTFKKSSISHYLQRLLVFIVFALPVLVWKFGQSGIALTSNRHWFDVVNRSMLSNVFYYFNGDLAFSLITIGGICAFITYLLVQRSIMYQPHTKTINNFICAIAIIMTIQLLTSLYYPSVIIIQSQIIRAGIFVIIFSYMYFMHFTSESIVNNPKRPFQNLVLFVAGTFSISPIIVLLTLISNRFKKINSLSLLLGISSIMLAAILILKISYDQNVWRPGIHIYPIKDDNYKAQLWAKENTSVDSVFIVPPHLWWFYTLEWRVISERTVVTTLSEILEVAFSVDYLQEWEERFNDVAPDALSKFRGNQIENRKITASSYYSLSSEQIQKIAFKYHAKYIVFERPHSTPFKKVYQNDTVTIYEIPILKQ